jgi:hypothetical protein
MNTLLDEHQADKEVIESLLKTNRTLWRELEQSREMVHLLQQTKQGNTVKILQDLNGALYIAKDVEAVAAEDAQKLYDHLKSDLAMVEKYLGISSDPQPQISADQTVQPSQPADQPQVVAPPVDQSQVPPAAPAVDANGNPVQAAPAPDPNAQPQPEQPVMPPLQ